MEACVLPPAIGAHAIGTQPAADVCAGNMASRVAVELEDSNLFVNSLPVVPLSPVTECLAKWREELIDDFDADFILNGIEFGFTLIDASAKPEHAFCKNYKSATSDNKSLSEEQIKVELEKGRYIVSEVCPPVVSALGAIPKSQTKVRLIHDLSRPLGGVNKHSTDNAVKFPTIDEATRHMSSNTFLAKIDLKEAYRSIPLHPTCYGLTGLQWHFSGDDKSTFFFDARLPFGASKSCKIFQSLTNAIVRMLARRNIIVSGYIDDFLIIEDSADSCQRSLDCIVALVESLGLCVNWDKVSGPAQQLVFLGVDIDCTQRTLALPAKKLAETKVLIASWIGKKKATKKSIQQLIGKLNWCCRVMLGGRTFLRNLVDLLLKVSQPHHYVRLGVAARADLDWWSVGIELFHGFAPFPADIPVPSSCFSTDACLEGGGSFHYGDWFYVNWVWDIPSFASKNINVLELKTVLLSARRWGHLWEGRHILVHSDNSSTVASINKSTSRSGEMLLLVKELFWCSVFFNFKLSAAYLPGKLNVISDRISRLHDVQCANDACILLFDGIHFPIGCKNHMSEETFLALQEVWHPGWNY
jgi:hypothetical protein